MLHGLTGSGACWTPVARALGSDVDVVLPDARGHGGSSTPPDGYRYDTLADDVEALFDALELSRPILVGHSMGGLTASVVASRGGGLLGGLVLVDPTFLEPERQREVFASDVAEQHRRAVAEGKPGLVADSRARHPHRSDEMVDLVAAARLAVRFEPFAILQPPNPDYRELVRAFEVPTLLVVGDKTVVTLEMARELEALNPLLRTEKIEGAGHGVPFDQPERVGRMIASFVSGLA